MSNNWVEYEWCIELYEDADLVDDEPEIVDLNFDEKLSGLRWLLEKNERLVLVRTTQYDKQWAYVDDSKMLPKYFSIPEADGKYHETNVRVPQRFHREIARVACGGV